MPEAWGFFDNRYYNMDTNINENYELKSINKS